MRVSSELVDSGDFGVETGVQNRGFEGRGQARPRQGYGGAKVQLAGTVGRSSPRTKGTLNPRTQSPNQLIPQSTNQLAPAAP